jgi:hypothetical protein
MYHYIKVFFNNLSIGRVIRQFLKLNKLMIIINKSVLAISEGDASVFGFLNAHLLVFLASVFYNID